MLDIIGIWLKIVWNITFFVRKFTKMKMEKGKKNSENGVFIALQKKEKGEKKTLKILYTKNQQPLKQPPRKL